MIEITTMEMDALPSALLNNFSPVLIKLVNYLSAQDSLPLQYVEIVTLKIINNVMMEIKLLGMDVQLHVKYKVDTIALLLENCVLRGVEMLWLTQERNAMMEINKMEMDAVLHAQNN